MKLVKLVLALLFGGRFIAACEDAGHRGGRPLEHESGEVSAEKQLYGDEDDEGW
jgi:hypothetical protein